MLRKISLLFLLAAAAVRAGEPSPAPWSYTAPQRSAPPPVHRAEWCQTEVDHFLLARMEAAGVSPNPDADRLTLLRRASFDLTGLPPSPGEQTAFLRDPAPEPAAFARVVDRLLASPQFGERWARHWLDVVHYADSVGRTWNAPYLAAWRYRDWVIDSLNADKNFALFAAEQIAGDLLPARNNEERRGRALGTGLLTLSALPLPESGGLPFELDRIDDQIDVTTRAFLGLTMSCARCHDHKTDPITQHDYYSLAGIFFSSRTFSGGERGEYVSPDQLVRLPVDPGSPPDLAMGVIEGEPHDCAIRIKGDAAKPGEAPPRGVLRMPGLPALRAISKHESGRLQLAEWIVSPQNPLTARVLVNRVWAHLFGRGLVATVDDFGTTGEKPTHPELLDTLAVEFSTEMGWSVKKLIRTLMISRAYQLSSASEPGRLAHDAVNATFWRMNPKRLEVEAIRDEMLSAAGRLSLARPVGMPAGGNGGKGKRDHTHPLLDEMSPYRTIYLPVLRELLPDLYTTFDFPEPSQIKGERETTNVPGQALFFLNSPLAYDSAEACATRLLADPSLHGEEPRIERAFTLLLGRPPAPEEKAGAKEFLTGGTPSARWRSLVLALMATTEFRSLW